MYKDATTQEINKAMEAAWKASCEYRKMPLKTRADFMRAIGSELQNNADELIKTAMGECNLPQARLKGELERTVFQLNQYAEASEEGRWLEATIDTVDPAKKSPRNDIRKMLVPLGPVIVFGSSNFPFAYSTAGGDTACAFAAGCPVIVKAHPAHAETSEMVANAILKAVQECKMPEGIFAHIHGASIEVGKALVMHKRTSAVGFTGSFAGGKQIFDWGNQRNVPIPVFAEMGSINPVFLLPEKLKESYEEIAKMYSASITQSVGQFCTNPGLIIGIESEELDKFVDLLGKEIQKIAPAKMLHPGIARAFEEKRNNALQQKNVTIVSVSEVSKKENEGTPTIATTKGEIFLQNPILDQEVFGPFSLVVSCKDMNEMIQISSNLEGQLTSTLLATENDFISNAELIESVENICGRYILNGVPTGVEVCLSMQHGGPFPATTDSRFTSVGADGIKRFARPVAFQNWENKFLPDALKNENPLNIWRVVNNEMTRDRIEN
ncbi:MAG TPA: aldehyde dehydrogenase (NADP(+)) [Hanamia sp.]|jgi:NADP-dependent aldehyde dehydrogenase|nr:aldehyde dehydrogenase (NADP(+)) [Hanamia sp.]